MKQNTIEKFTGLAIQPNSLTVPAGRLERAENAVINQDFLITKCRGENLLAQFPTTQSLNRIWEYGTSLFGISQNTLYRLVTAPVAATVQCFNNSTNVSVRRTGHGLRNADFVSQFTLPTTDVVAKAFDHLSADLYGVRQIQNSFSGLVTVSGATTTIDLLEHGLVNGNNIQISTNSRGIAAGTYAVTVVDSDTFTIATASTSTGALTFVSLDQFRITATNPANADATSASNAATYLHYTVVTSPNISITPNGIGVSRQFAAQGNSYFTTDNGVYKLEREDLPALEAGLPPGLDVQVALNGALGPLKANSQTGYRIVFGRRDAQGNLILSAPSQQAIAYNGTRVGISISVTVAAGVATAVVTDSGHPFTSVGGFVTIYSITGFSPAVTPVPTIPFGSTASITYISSSSFSFTFAVDPSTTWAGAPAAFAALIEYGFNPTATITASIPSELLSTDYLYQVYRTSGSVNAQSEPFDDFRLVAEQNLTTTDVSNAFLTYVDDLPQLLLEGQPFLYTNSNQEGILQANTRPPRSEDITVFKGYAFFANTVQYHLLSLTTVDPSLIANGDTLTIADGTNTETYVFVGSQNAGPPVVLTNDAVGNESVTLSATIAAGVATITSNNHGFLANDVIRVTAPGTSNIPIGEYTLTGSTTTNNIVFAVPSGATGTVTFEGLRRGTSRIVKRVVTTTSTTVSQAIFYTASYLIKAINRNAASVVFAQYTSEVTAPPGSITLLAKNLQQAAFSLTASSASAVGAAFEPRIPTSGTTIQSVSDVGPNRLYISKLNEPEAVPLFNIRDVGSRASPILRVAALRDSVIILKDDGIYRLNGDSTNNFTVTALDNTVFVKATDSVVVLNNSVYCLSNQGVVQITDSAVRIVSRIIEPLLTAILGQDLEDNTSAVGYESERLYLLSVKRPNTLSSVADVTYCYNYLTEAWTSWTGANKVFFNALLRPSDDKLYSIPTLAQNKVVQERKQQNLVDYSGQEYCAPVIKAMIGTAASTAGSDVVQVTTLTAHGLSQGQLVTVSRPSSTITAAFTGGTGDLVGLRTVQIISDTVFTFTASANATASAVGDIYTAQFISEAPVAIVVSSGVSTLPITTAEPHGLITGDAINIDEADAAVLAAFAAANDVLGYRSVTVTSPTTFTIQATNAPTGSATGNVVMTDKKQSNLMVTIDTVGQFAPTVGDAIVTEGRLYKIEDIVKATSVAYIATLQTTYKARSNALAFVHQAYRTLVKFSPLTMGQAGLLKQFSEFQCAFRNFQSCTKISLDYSSDSVTSSTKQSWNYKVGTNGTAPSFGGWGELEWGNFPWGGEASIQRIYTTQPAVILRTYVPREVFVGTFIQPILDHKVAGEPLELQAISLFSKPVTQRTTR